MINLNDLLKASPGSEIWRKLVMERSENCDLWVSGTVKDAGCARQWGSSLNSFLGPHWTRVRAFHVVVNLYGLFDFFELGLLQLIQHPAQRLEWFSLQLTPRTLYNSPDTIDKLNTHPLFSNHSPSLQVFSSNLHFHPTASWASQLRSLSISSTSSLSTPNILDLVSQLSLLETLTLDQALCRPTNVPRPSVQSVTLRHLKQFTMVDYNDSCGLLFEHLHLPKECFLDLKIFLLFSSFRADPLGVCEGISRCMAHSPTDSTTALQLSINCSYTFILLSNQYPGRVESNLYLKIHVAVDVPQNHWGAGFENFFKAMVTCVLNSSSANHEKIAQVKAIELAVKQSAPPLTSASDLERLLRSASGIEKMKATLTTMVMLLSFRLDTPPLLFPALRELVLIKIVGYGTMDLAPEDSTLLTFLDWRRDAGVPIEVLDFSFSPVAGDVNVNWFRGMTGMKIRWKNEELGLTKEYIC
ncbi:hypothetical protein GALMADRAFT_243399 [Galerina marginata CBS 339.88]|uniref:F-box domain-containing protein n=1 Tax=Galerina marginata (strain CBS 339.88) TaxID=685588 RepID=A0A067THJ1_GALM3|nr:hypothetical protein GALMADRAFT_243399 [Galerina marginata CBS 339.88]